MITLYGCPRTRSTRVNWMLEELGLDYQFELIDLPKGQGRSEAFLAINPSGKVPALRVDDLLLTESAAMLTHLGDRFGNGSLVPPAGTEARAHYEQWCYFAMAELEQPLWTIGKHSFVLPEERRVAEVLPTAQWEFQIALQLLSQGLGEQDFILGEQFSAADILLGQTLEWGHAFKQPIEQANLQHYRQRLSQRPGRLKAIQTESNSAT